VGHVTKLVEASTAEVRNRLEVAKFAVPTAVT